MSFLKDQKDINAVAPGTAGFDLNEMPWEEGTLKEDLGFLLGDWCWEPRRKNPLPWRDQGDRGEIDKSAYGGDYDRYIHAQ